jgi:predicted nucleic acid-binding protein
MGWVEQLHGTTVCVDTSPLIFFIEEHPTYGPLVDPFFEAVSQGNIRLITSTVALLEVLVHPIRNHDEHLAQRYNDILLSSPHVSTVPVTAQTAQTAAELRAEHNLKTPDAIHLATAIGQNAVAFLTNDRDFPKIDGIEILKLRDLTP